MNLSSGEKLITLMLCDLFKKLDVQSEFSPEFISEAIHTGNMWALSRKYGGIAGENEQIDPAVVANVHDILDMWESIERAYASFDDDQKAELLRLAPVFGKNPTWPGFDGNHEGEYGSVASIMIDHMGFHANFRGRSGKNSHAPTLETARRMHPAFKRHINSANFGNNLSVEQVAEILNEQTHPSRR